MTLQNLAKIGQLKPHAPAAAEIQRLLIAVKRNLADAAQQGNSDETRFDCALKSVSRRRKAFPTWYRHGLRRTIPT